MITLPLIFLVIWLCATTTDIIPIWVCIVCCAFWAINNRINAWVYITMLRAAKENNKKYEIYDINDSLFTKIDKIKTMFYAKEIEYSEDVKIKLELIDKYHRNLPICICKTPMSISDNEKVLGFPKDFTMRITDAKVYNGAGYIVLYMGNVLTMPGLAKDSNYLKEVYNG